MVISQLPHIEIPSEETLNDEDKHIIEAFDIILNGYKRSQSRLQAISKAYIKLESIAQALLKASHKNDKKISPKKEESIVREKTTRKELSPLQLRSNDSHDDILTVDLTYDFDTLEQSSDSATRVTSPIFGQQRKKSKKNSSSDEADSFKDSIQKITKNEAGPSTKKVANHEESLSANEAAEENEENRPPLNKPNFKSPKCLPIDSTQLPNESQTVAKIGFSKTVYNIDSHKTPTGKRSRQATLVFQPQTSKANLSYPEKQISKPNDRKKSDFFVENYRNTKKPPEKNCQEEEESPEIFAADLVDKKSTTSLFPKSAVAASAETPKSDRRQNPEKNLSAGKENSFIIATPSQIDETARSLFDDEDLAEFEASKDLLNTCLDSPSIVENVAQPKNLKDLGNREKSDVPIASTSKSLSSQFCGMDSIDETFFAPVEIEIPKKQVGKMDKPEAKDSRDKNRNLKRKTGNETQIETAKELGDLEVQDIDWDQDITTDNWPPPKRPLNNSFDVLPPKKKKSPNFAYKGKVERNHAERAKLPGWDCKDCEKYYGTMNLPEEELKKHMNRCSRHRSKYNPRYFTPKNFWNPVFPDATDSSDFSDDESFEKRKKL